MATFIIPVTVAELYWSDPDFWGSCSLISEAEFYGEEEE